MSPMQNGRRSLSVRVTEEKYRTFHLHWVCSTHPNTFTPQEYGLTQTTSYVEQLELQQQILVKALKTLWKRYAPDKAQDNLGDEPSIHAIVQNLDELGASSSYKHLALDFIFDQDAKKAASVTVLSTEPSPEPNNPAVHSHHITVETQIGQNKMERNSSIKTESTSSATSPTFSTGSSQLFHNSPSPIDIPYFSQNVSIAQVLPTPKSSVGSGFRSNRPAFCPLPPRPNFVPVIPLPMEVNEKNTCGGYLQLSPALTDSLWQFREGDWENHDFGAEPMALESGFDQEMEGLMTRDQEVWVK